MVPLYSVLLVLVELKSMQKQQRNVKLKIEGFIVAGASELQKILKILKSL